MFLRLRPLLARVPVPAGCLAGTAPHGRERAAQAADFLDTEANAWDAATALSSWAALSGCDGDRDPGLQAPLREGCRALLSRIADADTLLERRVALPLLVGLTTGQEANAALRERYRQLLWLIARMPESGTSREFIGRVWSDGEVAALRAAAEARGDWPPPPDWVPADPDARRLVPGHSPVWCTMTGDPDSRAADARLGQPVSSSPRMPRCRSAQLSTSSTASVSRVAPSAST